MLSLPCPAKINLFLEIRGQRADGFHELGTLFQAVDACDTLSAEPWDTISLSGAEHVTDNPEDNLIIKAARLVKARYADKVSPQSGIRCTLDKRLPSGAGLGGGSSDAATALRLTNTVWNLHLSTDELITLGAALGSDVPFFLSSSTAYGEGRGEILEPAPAPFPFHVVIATPACHVETAKAYRDLARYRHSVLGGAYGNNWGGFRRDWAVQAQTPEIYSRLHNDFQAPVMAEFPEIQAVFETLNQFGPVKTMLSGSGASVFALFFHENEAQTALTAVKSQCRFAVKTRFTTSTPAA
jgi:4-diphosphocytidyl-2-C-methyl-D-erythritol kinase